MYNSFYSFSRVSHESSRGKIRVSRFAAPGEVLLRTHLSLPSDLHFCIILHFPILGPVSLLGEKFVPRTYILQFCSLFRLQFSVSYVNKSRVSFLRLFALDRVIFYGELQHSGRISPESFYRRVINDWVLRTCSFSPSSSHSLSLISVRTQCFLSRSLSRSPVIYGALNSDQIGPERRRSGGKL